MYFHSANNWFDVEDCQLFGRSDEALERENRRAEALCVAWSVPLRMRATCSCSKWRTFPIKGRVCSLSPHGHECSVWKCDTFCVLPFVCRQGLGEALDGTAGQTWLPSDLGLFTPKKNGHILLSKCDVFSFLPLSLAPSLLSLSLPIVELEK